MYCVGCGSKVNKTAKYCAKCGCPVNGNEEQNPYLNNVNNVNQVNMEYVSNEPYVPSSDDKKKKRTAMIIAIGIGLLSLIGFVAIIVAFIWFTFSTLEDYETSEFLKLGDTEVRNFFDVVDEGSVCGVNMNTNYGSHNSNTLEIDICYSKDFEERVEEYFSYMKENYDYIEIPSKYYRTLIVQDGNSNYVIEIDVDYDNAKIIYKRYYDKDFSSTIKDEEVEDLDDEENEEEEIQPEA